MKPALLLAAVLLASAPVNGRAAPDRLKLLDVSADVLPVGASEFGVFWARYARSFTPGLQLSTHIALDAVGLLNMDAKYRLLDRPELRMSVETGFLWAAILALGTKPGAATPLVLFVPFEFHATVPLADDLELDLGGFYRASITRGAGQSLGVSSLRCDLTLARYDASGAWLFVLRFPLLSRADVRLDSLLGQTDVTGAIVLDDLASFGGLVARDLAFGKTAHLRVGLGYRRTPGMVFVESLGHVLVSFDLYWR